MNKFILATAVSLFAAPAFAWAPSGDEQKIPENIQAEIQLYAELGASATGEEFARAFEENWEQNTDEYLYFSMRSIEVLGVELAGQLYGAGALWPRTPTTLTVSNAD